MLSAIDVLSSLNQSMESGKRSFSVIYIRDIAA